MKKVKIYITMGCPYCRTLKEFLKEYKVDFEEIDISEDEKARNYIIEKSGQMELPIMEINGEVVAGFDKNKIIKLLNINE